MLSKNSLSLLANMRNAANIVPEEVVLELYRKIEAASRNSIVKFDAVVFATQDAESAEKEVRRLTRLLDTLQEIVDEVGGINSNFKENNKDG